MRATATNSFPKEGKCTLTAFCVKAVPASTPGIFSTIKPEPSSSTLYWLVKRIISAVAVHTNKVIREKMFEVLYSDDEYDFLDEESLKEIEIMRKDFSIFDIKNIESGRPLLTAERNLEFYTFTGTKVNRTIALLLNIAGISNRIDENNSSITVDIGGQDFVTKFQYLLAPLSDIDTHLALLLDSNPTLLDFSKWGAYLPQKYKVQLLKNKYYDIEYTEKMMGRLNIVVNK